ncbi:dihydrolipoamide acetyltransferase [Dictyobacter alpinus]|uniref:Dihydrolipoamide acetyltransferase n=1 Tax=Dictyobacter alpinus TaxID=2014873 RepID=A0A402BJ83_9CHLR|nr:alpha/beta hydrolase [Dictyobacter alpinus]GCE31357.1 dihydrolipoamide acetyltransferase [Dictyobacter alpinus]
MILVHGLSGSMRWWQHNVQALAQDHCVYLIDLPGFGTMRRVRNRFAIVHVARWLLAWMEAVKIQRAHFMGHSMGGYICIWIAAHHPEVVSRLILISPAVLTQIHTVWGYTRPLLTAIRYIKKGFFSILAFDALRAGPLTLLRAAHDLLSVDAQGDITKITAPTLLVWGEHDTLIPPSVGKILCTTIANSYLVVLKNASHVSMYDQPEHFNRLAETFLKGQSLDEASSC